MAHGIKINEVGMPTSEYGPEDFEYFADEIRSGSLPFDENESELIEIHNEFGETLAHVAAEEGLLSIDFSHWDHTSFEGIPVAHYAAAKCNLPDNFSEWDIEDSHGIKTAYIAIENDCCMGVETCSQYEDDFNEFLEEKESTTLEEARNHTESFVGNCLADLAANEEDN